jgi:spore germination protein YaaH
MIEKIKQNLNLIICLVLFALVVALSMLSYTQYMKNIKPISDKSQPFSDVPTDSYAYESILQLRTMGITEGIGSNRFGYGKTMTRGEFITSLVKALKFEMSAPVNGSFLDNQNSDKFYYAYIEAALNHGIITNENETFRPDYPITCQDAVNMIINGLGYKELAEKLYYLNNSFENVASDNGYITMAEDFGIISTDSAFDPTGNITREQAATMLVRMLGTMDRKIENLNGFYAISSSSQKEKIEDFTSVCFGWCKLIYDKNGQSLILNMDQNAFGYNEFFLPKGFNERLSTAKSAGVPSLLMVYASQDTKITNPATSEQSGLLEYVLKDPETYSIVIDDIIQALTQVSRDEETGSFDGVAIDFEGLRGEEMKIKFNSFLKDLRVALDKEGRLLYVAVHPLMHPMRSSVSIDGYDYRAIGDLADRVILMAHDYDAKRLTKSDMARGINITPLSPIEDIYYALKAITDKRTGVQDKDRIMLQISFDWTVWQQKDGKTVNSLPLSYNLENFMKLLNSSKEIDFHYYKNYENPYLQYMDNKNGTKNTVWYENSKSVMAKTRLASFFGIQGISLWRIGLIPDYQNLENKEFDMDVWQCLLNEMSQGRLVQTGTAE